MKNLLVIFFCMAAAATAVAQSKIQASEIIKQIDEGRNVEYNNVVIVGELDLTDLHNRRHFIEMADKESDAAPRGPSVLLQRRARG